MYDTHMHTKPFSTDSEMELSEVLKRKEESELGIVLTEHMDYDFPAPGVYRFDVDAYFKAYSPHRSDQFLLGVEIGLQRSVAEKNHKFVKTWPFDMVIGSVHAVCGKDLYELSYFQSFPEKKSAYETYLRDVYENIRDFDDFDTLGHIDYICRKAPYSDQLLRYEEFSEMIDKILMLLAKRKKSLEINTRLFDQKEAVQELEIICSRFAKLGGQMVTIGSDAHKASAIGSRIENAYELARKCGLIPVVYKARQPYPVK
ncbi:MAG: histidinol-phosphatase HisJ family protein [Eubacteriales bacterium]|nr:histidinol-phosphatase HisJ family protein [Eubacteriales bacterium]